MEQNIYFLRSEIYENIDNLDKKVGFLPRLWGPTREAKGMALDVDPIRYIKEVNIKVPETKTNSRRERVQC